MSTTTPDLLWPRSFWSDVPDADRAGLREVLAELLGRGVLLGRFDKDETLVLLTLWRLYDDEISTGSQEAVIVTVDQLWAALKVYFDKISTPEKSQIEACLARIRRHRLIRTLKPEGMTQAGEMQIEILPSLARVIPFDDIAAWQQRVELHQPVKDSAEGEEGAA